MSDPVRTVIDALSAAGCAPKPNGHGWKSKCPGHDDHHPSLDIDRGDDGRVLLLCRSHGCSLEQILDPLGLKQRDLFTGSFSSHARQIVSTYQYVDEHGQVLCEKVRFSPKGFAQRRPDGAGGWTWNLKGVRRILYRLPDLIRVSGPTTVYVTEGEKDADRLAREGLVATCCPMGAGKWKQLDDDSALLGHRVIILPDHDDVGRRHAEDVASRLNGRVGEVRILKLPDLPEGGDVSDFLDAGHDADDLRRLAEAASVWRPGPPPVAPPYRDGKESQAAVRRMAKTSEGLRNGMVSLSEHVAEWFDRRGPDTLDKEYPVAYTAAAVNVTRQHLYYLADIGRVRRLLPVSDAYDTPDRILKPLAQLLKERAADVPDAFGAAREKAKSEQKRLSRHHTQAIVEAMLPPKPSLKGREKCQMPYDTRANPAVVEALHSQVNECYEAFAATSATVPARIWELLQELDHLTYLWKEDTTL